MVPQIQAGLYANQQQNYASAWKKILKLNRPKHILILGSGFAGIETLRRLQKKFEHDNRVELTLVSKDNFLLFTPMLPEVSVGMIETRHIITPVRAFCKKATFGHCIRRHNEFFWKQRIENVHVNHEKY